MQIHELGELFEQVQMRNMLGDGKTFPDCLPKRSLTKINKDYLQQKDHPDFDLQHFIRENFEEPQAYAADYKSDVTKPIQKHIEDLWGILTREPAAEAGSLLSLPYPYIVPGGRFREIYYWDSYFTMLGLQVSQQLPMIQNMINNFSYLIDHIGYIPNGNRTYFLGRSQPPFYSLMIRLLSEELGKEVIVQYLSYLESEYKFWMRGANDLDHAAYRVVKMNDGSILNRYWDDNDTPRPEAFQEDVELAKHSGREPKEVYRHLRAAAESGWDFSSRWFMDGTSFATIHTTDIVPVDLNCLIFHLEQMLAEGFSIKGDKSLALHYTALAENRKAAIKKFCWNDTQQFFFDYDFEKEKQKEIYSLAASFPLFFGVATPEQANAVAHVLKEEFLKPYGLVSTLKISGQQWDAPNGWAPLQWITYAGLKKYNADSLAEMVRSRWSAINIKVYQKTGKMTEKYNVVSGDAQAGGGEYPNQDGFGWTNGVFLAMNKR